MPTATTNNTLAQTVMLATLETRCTTFTRTNAAIRDQVTSENGAANDAGNWSTKLLPQEVIKPLQQCTTLARNTFKFRTLRWMCEHRNTAMIPAKNVQNLLDELNTIRAELHERVDVLIANWPKILDDARKRAGGLFVEEDLPSDPQELHELYDISIRVTPLPDASDFDRVLQQVNQGLAEQLAEQQLKAQREAETQARQELYERLLRPLRALSNKCRGLNDGEAKAVRASITANILAVCDVVGDLNFSGDAKLDKLVESIRPLGEISHETLKGDAAATVKAREQVAKKADAAAKKVDKALSALGELMA